MIAIDTSALVAIILEEDEAELFDRRVAAQTTLVGGPTLVECHQVIRQKTAGPGPTPLDAFIERPTVRVVPFGQEHFAIAARAFDQFGKGRGHPAQLNFGDCLSYAVAKAHGVPLLFKGGDFPRTDLLPFP